MVAGLSCFTFWEREAEDKVTASGWRETLLLFSSEFEVPVFVQPAPANWGCAHCEKGAGAMVSWPQQQVAAAAHQALCARAFPGLLHSRSLRARLRSPLYVVDVEVGDLA